MFKSHAFKTFFLSYLIFIAITLTTFAITYRLIYNIIDKNNEDLSSAMLNQATNTVEPYTEDIGNIINRISKNSDLSDFLTKEIFNPSSRHYDPGIISKLIPQLQSLSQSSPFEDVYIYSHINNKIITTSSIFSPEEMYGSFLRFSDMDFNEFYESYLKPRTYNRLYPEMDITLSGEDSRYILSMTSFPILDEQVSGNLMLFINSQKLLDTLSNSFDSGISYSYFYYKDTLLAQTPNAPKLEVIPKEAKNVIKANGDEYMLYTSGNKDEYTFVIAIPTKTAMHSLTWYKWLIMLSLLCSTVIYALTALILSHYNVRPLKNIISHFGATTSPVPDEYAMISDSISSLITEKNNLQAEHTKNLPILVSNYLHMLINGHMADTDEILETTNRLGLDLPWKSHYLLILSIVDITASELGDIERLITAKEHLGSLLAHNLRYISCDISVSSTAFLIDSGTDPENAMLKIETAVNKAADSLSENCMVRIKAALSEPFEQLDDIFFAYQAVMDIFNNGLKTHFNNTIWCTSLPDSLSNYYYPSELESKLLQSVKQHNRDQIFSILDNILEKNDDRTLLTTDSYRLNFNIKSTVYKVLNTEKINQDHTITSYIEQLDENLPIEDFFSVAKALFSYITEQSKENEPDTDLGEVFIRFVTDSYTNPDFCRHTFAEKFHITDDYVSKLFKEYTGFQFHEYITKLRIEHACRLLKETKHSTEKIAEEVGYNNVMSFRRAFKAYTGTTPKDYKSNDEK